MATGDAGSSETEDEMLRRHRDELLRGRSILNPTEEQEAETSRMLARQQREWLALRSAKGKRTEVALLRSTLRRFENYVEEWPESQYNRGVRDALRYALGQAVDPQPEAPPGEDWVTRPPRE